MFLGTKAPLVNRRVLGQTGNTRLKIPLWALEKSYVVWIILISHNAHNLPILRSEAVCLVDKILVAARGY